MLENLIQVSSRQTKHVCADALTLVSDAPTSHDDTTAARTVHLFDLDGDFDVVYERPGGDETVSMELDDPDYGISLDRANYPQDTGVVITIDDQALNVDPTGEDTWYFNTDGDPLYMTTDNVENIGIITNAALVEAQTIADALKQQNADYKTADKKRDDGINNRAQILAQNITGSEAKRDNIIRLADEALKDPIISPAEIRKTQYISRGPQRLPPLQKLPRHKESMMYPLQTQKRPAVQKQYALLSVRP